MIKYKLTDAKGYTFNNTLWGERVEHTTDGKGELCGPGWIHWYNSPLIASFLNPIHANFRNPILWEVECYGKHKMNCVIKGGSTRVTTLRKLPTPEITANQRTSISVLCAKRVFHNQTWNKWADDWLNNIDRTSESTIAVDSLVSFVAACNSSLSDAVDSAIYACRSASDEDEQFRCVYAAHAVIYAVRSTNGASSIDLESLITQGLLY